MAATASTKYTVEPVTEPSGHVYYAIFCDGEYLTYRNDRDRAEQFAVYLDALIARIRAEQATLVGTK